MKKTIIILIGILLILMFVGCNQQENQANDLPTQAPVDVPTEEQPIFELPENTPDANNGEVIYQENCSKCHDVNGIEIYSKELTFDMAPVLWFDIVSRGNEASGMPSFIDTLDVQSRWDVLAYLYNAEKNLEVLETGKTAYLESCSSCHGEFGNGGSVNENHAALDFSNVMTMSMYSEAYIHGSITPGVGNEIHVVEGLEDSTREAIAYFVRTFSFPYFEEIIVSEVVVEPTEETSVHGSVTLDDEVVEEFLIEVEGSVLDGVSGEGIADIPVKLFVVENYSMEELTEYDGVTTESGEFKFSDVTVTGIAILIVDTEFEGVTYQSEIVSMETDFPENAFVINVYETSDDLSQLQLEGVEVFFVFDNAETMLIQENWLITNTSDKAIVPPVDGDNTFDIELPANLSNLGFSEYSTITQLTQTETGFRIEQPFLPGEEENFILFAYEVPYTNKYEWSREFPMSVVGAQAFIPSDSVSIKGSEVEFVQERIFNNLPFDSYTFSEEDGSFSLTVKGRNPLAESILGLDQEMVLIIAGFALFGLVLGGFILYIKRNKSSDLVSDLPDSDEIMDQIIALDEAYENDEISETDYNIKRDALKELLQVTKEDDQS